MKLQDFGYNQKIERIRIEHNLNGFDVGRVALEHKERYVVKTEKGELDAEITGNLRYSSKSRKDFPAVGDWVALTIYDSDFSVIHKVLPRSTLLYRQAVGNFGEIQVIAANIDYAFIVLAIDTDFNLNRLERYLTICHSSKVIPIIVLTKIDLINEQKLDEIVKAVNQRNKNVKVVAISNETKHGYKDLKSLLKKGKTYCMLGSSGVGKSTLLNNLSEKKLMKTDVISKTTKKGRHVTTHREMIILDDGAIIIDNPGMREVGILNSERGLDNTFDKITYYAQYCKFNDCKHINETGCAVLNAVEKGELEKGSYANYIKMQKEKAYFESTAVAKRQKDKNFGNIKKNYKKYKNKNIF